MVIKPKEIRKDLYLINEKNLFKALIYPLTREDFFDNILAKKALVIKG